MREGNETSCRYNYSVTCGRHLTDPDKCRHCGWNPGERRKRIQKLRKERGGGKEKDAVPQQEAKAENEGGTVTYKPWNAGLVQDLCGQRFGRLEVIAYAGRSGDHGSAWRCRCDCGAMCTVQGQNLKSGRTRSCGCLRKGRKKRETSEIPE